jgi:hypothetical protein
MYGATPSPEPYKCLTDPPIHKDIWYCLTNGTNQTIGVTITTNIQLFIEVNQGCQCPPGPVIACGEGPLGTNQFVLGPNEQALIRLIDWFDLPNDELKGSMFIQNKIIVPEIVNFYEDVVEFQLAVLEAGMFAKGIWGFKPDHLLDGESRNIDDFLDIFSHPVNAPGVWDDGQTNLWPPEIDNVQFSANLNPQGPFEPHGPTGLWYGKPGAVPELNNNALVANWFVDSFDIISGPPAGSNHTAMALELIGLDVDGIPDVVTFHISVYDKNDVEIGKYVIDAIQGEKPFLGIMTKDPSVTIGRVDIWDVNGFAEGISYIELYQPGVPEPVNFYTDPSLFFEAAFAAGKFSKFFWDFKPYWDDGDNIPGIVDPLDIFTHTIPPQTQDPWTDPAGNDLWPPEVDNVQFTANMNPQGPLAIPDGQGLAFVKAGYPPFNLDNNALVDNFAVNSFDIISGPPAGDNHTAMWFDVISFGPVPTVIHVSVYDKNDVEMGKFIVDYVGGKAFVGVLTKDPAITIGRVDIWDVNVGYEGIAALETFQQLIPGNECSPPGVCGTHQQCGTGSPFNCYCFEVDYDPAVGMCIQDFPCADVQPCPPGGCPPGFVCVTNSCCGPEFCVPIIKCDQPAAPIPPDISGPTGAGNWIDPAD